LRLLEAARAASRRFGTPLYLYDLARLRADAAVIAGAFPDPWIRLYALKANGLPGLVRELPERGFGASAVSGGELALAARGGIPPGSTALEGIGKTDADLRAAVRSAATGDPIRWIAIESPDEADALVRIARSLSPSRPLDVLFRLNPEVAPETHHGLAVGAAASKFGMTASELSSAVETEQAAADVRAAAAARSTIGAGEIVFEHVTFRYPGTGHEALRDLSLRIAPGETVAIVGRNGAGKSTLIKLICRLYDPTEGRILLDGVDLRDIDPSDVRRLIGGMFQDYVTYQASAAENIGLGELERIEDRDAVEDAARKGGADSLLERLPDGWDTPLGKWFDGGVELSGGEWQKIALGRAFMRDARILVLDEPTSALDAQAEFELFARLRKLAEGRTAIYISHRFSTVRQADRILFLEHAELVEQGTHDQLMALGGRYARLFTLQASAYTGAPVGELDDEVAAGVGD